MADDPKIDPNKSPNPNQSGSTEGKGTDSPSQFATLTADEKNRILANQTRMLNEAAVNKAAMEARLKELEGKVNAPPVKAPAAMNKEFFDNPVPTITDLIRKELKE